VSVRDGFLGAVRDVIDTALAAPQPWGHFPTCSAERKFLNFLRLGNRLRVLVLDDDGSRTPTPELHDGQVDDVFNFHLRVQVNEPAGPSTLGHRALDAIKRALRDAVTGDGALWPYTKLAITFEEEQVLLPDDGEGRFAEFVLPCTAMLPDNLGGGSPEGA
jgi:hypothetical protein